MVEVINLGSTQAPYWEYTKTLAPNEHFKLNYVTDCFHLLEVSAPDVLKVSFGGTMIQTPFTAGIGYRLNEPVEFVELWNTSNNNLTVKFAVGIGDIKDSRLTVSGTVNNNIVGFNGYTKVTAGTSTASTSYTYGANADISFMVTAGDITINISAGNIAVNNLNLPEGSSWNIKLATAGTITVTSNSGTYNYQIAEF